MTWRGMCGSGVQAGMVAIPVHGRIIPWVRVRGHLAFCAAVVGSTAIGDPSAWRPATTTIRRARTTTSVFVVQGFEVTFFWREMDDV